MSKHTRAALASVVSGISLCESFSDVHACIEALAGEPIMTHQMPRWHNEAKAELDRLYPEYISLRVTSANFAEFMEEHPEMSELVEVPPIASLLPDGPLDWIPAHVKAIVVGVGDQ